MAFSKEVKSGLKMVIVVGHGLSSPRFGIRDGTPKFEDEIVGEAKGLEVRVINRFRQLHSICLSLCKVPDLRC